MPHNVNQTPEEVARDRIDSRLRAAGWHVQDKDALDFNEGSGIAVREYQTDIGPADYVLFVGKQAVGVVEAKPDSWGARLTTVEVQSEGYANARLKWLSNAEPLPFLYESTGQITRFTNGRDPNPRSREVFAFHRPETLKAWMLAPRSFRSGIAELPPLNPAGLRECQNNAITRLEASLKADKPRALVQMATGSGKTFTAITQVYRLLKHADARRVLFLVDTRNLGEQAEQEFMAFIPNDDNRKFTELYNVQRLTSPSIAGDSQVVISTIQRMYATLKGEELAEGAEDENPAERTWRRKKPLPVVYNATLPPEYFDVVVIDECHRSIYNLWRQVIEYFDAYLIGLTATPDNRTYGFFRKNVVSEYSHERAVADKVNVGNEIYLVETRITRSGETLKAEQLVEKRERQTRARRWEVQEEQEEYTVSQLDRSVVNPDQIRTVIRAFRDNWPEIFPGREELPKTLIFAKTDSHADDIVQTVRGEFGEGNDFCRKITSGARNPKSSLAAFRNDYNPRIAVTVDMIATGTDVKPLECLLFMRDVKSRNYFEQMKGRGTRVLTPDDLRKVTPSAPAKTHYVIVDAIGVTRSLKTESQPLDTRPSVPFKDLAMGLMMGDRSEETVSSLAARLSRLDNRLAAEDRAKVEHAAGKPLAAIALSANIVETPATLGMRGRQRGTMMKADRNVNSGVYPLATPALGGAPPKAETPPARRAPDPEVLAKPTRRRFSAEYRLRIVEEADRCREPGEIGRLLRREGLYSSHLSTWRKARRQGALQGLTPRKRGPKPAPSHPLGAQVRRLEAQVARLEKELATAHTILEVQGKVAGLLGFSLRDGKDC